MKRIGFAILIIFLISISYGYAYKNITYVSQSNCVGSDIPCTCYQTNNNLYDYALCSELAKSYNIFKITDGQVKSNTAEWQAYYSLSNMIFLGNVSTGLVSDSTFCSHLINQADTTNRLIFSTGKNNQKTGCVFALGYVTFSGSDTKCIGTDFYKLVDEPITNELSVDPIINKLNDPVYSSTSPSYIFNGNGLIGVMNLADSIRYPTIAIGLIAGSNNDLAIFWGLDNVSAYTSTAWYLFDRTLWYTMGDWVEGEINGTIILSQDSYKPEETINITFNQNEDDGNSMTSARITIIYPDGSKPINDLIMEDTESERIKIFDSYVLEKGAPNGTYTVQVTPVAPGADIVTFTKTFDVIPYDIFVTTEQNSYTSGQIVNISIDILDSYNTTMLFNYNIDVINPNGVKTTYYSANQPQSFVKSYTPPSNAVGGKYTVNIGINDTEKPTPRKFIKTIEFTLKSGGNLLVNPSTWDIVTGTPGYKSQIFKVNNTGPNEITNLEIQISGINITLDKGSIDSIPSNQSATFNATANIRYSGTYTGKIILTSEEDEYTIAVNVDYSSTPIQNSLEVSPASLSVVTITDTKETRELTLENTAVISAENFLFSSSDSIKSFVTKKSLPTSIASDGTTKAEIEIDSNSLDEGVYTGTFYINSSVGTVSVPVNIRIISDLSMSSETMLLSLEVSKNNITALSKKGKDVSDLNDLYENIKTSLEEAKNDYENGDYDTAYTQFQEASDSLDTLNSAIYDLQNEKKDYSGIIWAFAIIIIIGIIGVFVYKYRDRIMDQIDRILKKQQPTSEEYEAPKGDYRTEYY